jgi:dynein heavy chain
MRSYKEQQALVATIEREVAEMNLMKKQLAKKEEEIKLALKDVQRVVENQQNINHADIYRLKDLKNPPPLVVKVLEAVYILIHDRKPTWDDLEADLQSADYIDTISGLLEPKGNSLKRLEYYFESSDFTLEQVSRVNKSAGTLFKVITGAMQYSTALAKVVPLREELLRLRTELTQQEIQLRAKTKHTGIHNEYEYIFTFRYCCC